MVKAFTKQSSLAGTLLFSGDLQRALNEPFYSPEQNILSTKDLPELNIQSLVTLFPGFTPKDLLVVLMFPSTTILNI